MTKVCTKCLQEKDSEEFHRNKRSKDGLRDRCKACAKAYHREHYLANKDVYLQRAQDTRQEFIDAMMVFYGPLKDKPCTDCKQKFPPCAMDFDHVRGVKKFNVSSAVQSRRPKEAILNEIAKCDLVCANCHRIRTWMRHQMRA